MQTLIATRLEETLGDRVSVQVAVNREYADRAVRELSATQSTVVVLLPSFSGSQPEGTLLLRAQGVMRTDVIAYTQSDEDELDSDSALELLDTVSAFLCGYAPTVYTDETPFPLYKTAQGFEDAEGGQVRAVATYEMEVWETHTA